jgi:SAM-dependent methyltransferase
MPLQSESVDVIVSVDTIEHVHRPADFLRECHRVLRPGGSAVFTTPCLLGYKNLLARYGGKSIFDTFWRVFHNRTLPYDTCYRANTPGTVRKLAAESGFAITKLVHVPEISWFLYPYPRMFAIADGYNALAGALGLKMFWNYMAFSLQKVGTKQRRMISGEGDQISSRVAQIPS